MLTAPKSPHEPFSRPGEKLFTLTPQKLNMTHSAFYRHCWERIERMIEESAGKAQLVTLTFEGKVPPFDRWKHMLNDFLEANRCSVGDQAIAIPHGPTSLIRGDIHLVTRQSLHDHPEPCSFGRIMHIQPANPERNAPLGTASYVLNGRTWVSSKVWGTQSFLS